MLLVAVTLTMKWMRNNNARTPGYCLITCLKQISVYKSFLSKHTLNGTVSNSCNGCFKCKELEFIKLEMNLKIIKCFAIQTFIL